MKTSTKVLLGIGTVAFVGTVSAVFISENVVKEIKSAKKRSKIKQFVNNTLGGNQKLLTVVNDLSEEEVSSVSNILSKIEESKKKISVSGDTAKEASEKAKNFLTNLADSWL